ncbi:MAG: hypothetical protein FWH38_05885 [Treponema sp.]|nr:hypothetical protein [Treponema sp.]
MQKKKFFNILALLAAIMLVFCLAGCNLLDDLTNDPGDSPGGGGGGGGDPVNPPATGNLVNTAWLNSNNWTIGKAFQTSSYTIDDWITVPNEKTLTILPGTSITFRQGSSGINIDAGGTLIAQGLPILLNAQGNAIGTTSGRIALKNSSVKWRGLEIHSTSDNILDFVDIVNAGSGTSTYSAALYLYGGIVSLTNSTISGSGANGITTYGGSGYLTAFTGNDISGSAKAPIYAESNIYSLRNLSSGTLLAPNTFSGNTNNYIHVADAGSMTANMTIRKMPISWRIYNRLSVNGTAELSVEPGTTIEFSGTGAGMYFIDDAVIDMEGDALNPIVLKNVVSGATWEGIRIYSTRPENVLNFVQIINAGSGNSTWNAALYLYGGVVSMTNSLIDGSGSNGITTYGASGYLAGFSGNTVSNSGKAPVYTETNIWSLRNISGDNIFTGNATQYVHVPDGASIPANQTMTLKKLSIPYYFPGGYNLNATNATMIIEPGTQLWMGSTRYFSVGDNSFLKADGTASERIVFRGLLDQAGYWNYIDVRTDAAGTSISYCDIVGGGQSATYGGCALYIYAATIALDNVLISKSAHYGIIIESTTNNITHSNVSFDNCASGNVWNYTSSTALPALP